MLKRAFFAVIFLNKVSIFYISKMIDKGGIAKSKPDKVNLFMIEQGGVVNLKKAKKCPFVAFLSPF